MSGIHSAGDESTDTPTGQTPPVVDYQSPTTTPPLELSRRDRVIYAMAVAWVLVCLFVGIGADRVRLGLAKKLAITSGAIIIVPLMLVAANGRRPWRAIVFLLVAVAVVFEMWFWN